MNAIQIIKNGIVKENPTFVLMLGMCPTLATTTSAMNGMSMGLATMAVLICTNEAMTRMKAMVCRYCKPKASSTNFCTHHVTMVASVKTKATAADIPSEVSTFFDTPRNGQMPRNCDRMILLTNIALMKINIYSIIFCFWLLAIGNWLKANC